VENQKYEDFYIESSKVLRDLKESINSGTIKSEICDDILYELKKLDTIEVEYIKKIGEKYEKLYPGMIKLFVFKNEKLDKQSSILKNISEKLPTQVKLRQLFRSKVKYINASPLKMKFFHKKAAEYFLSYDNFHALEKIAKMLYYNDRFPPGFKLEKWLKSYKKNIHIRKSIIRALFGQNFEPRFLASTKTNLNSIVYFKKKSSLYWNTITKHIPGCTYPNGKKLKMATHIFLVIIDEEKYKKYFSIEKIIANTMKKYPNNRYKFEIKHFNSTDLIANQKKYLNILRNLWRIIIHSPQNYLEAQKL